MKRTLLTALLLLVPTWAFAENRSRTLTFERGVEGVRAISIEAGVGDVEVRAGDDDTIRVEVEVTADRDGWFKKRAEVLQRVEIKAVVRDGVLKLEVTDPERRRDRDFGEDWSVQMPASLALDLELGVGDARVIDLGSAIDVEVGVGEVRIEGEDSDFGQVEGEAGVGDVDIRTAEGRHGSSGFIGHAASARGAGDARIDVEVGVGDITIRLR